MGQQRSGSRWLLQEGGQGFERLELSAHIGPLESEDFLGAGKLHNKGATEVGEEGRSREGR